MRPNQKNNRSRGRGRGNNKNQNPLNRSYDSNGPDVRIRGNAAHIAEKYTALARDALAAGDGVMAENYFQHAEHYNRIIMAAQAAREEEQREREAEREQMREERGGSDVPADEGAVESETVEADAANAEEEAPRRRSRRRKPKEDKPAEDAQQQDLSVADQPVVDGPIAVEGEQLEKAEAAE